MYVAAGPEGVALVEAAVLVDQSPIGRTPRSNPVTYIKAWDEVRRIFSSLPLARQRGYGPGAFSFNVEGGRCEACKGAGSVEVEMIFMADVYVPCDVCGGTRYKPELLDVTFKGLNISQVLELTVDEAIRFFEDEDAVHRWRQLAAHRNAQSKGRNGIFSDYHLRVCHVIRDYGMFDRDQAPEDSIKAHG